MTSKPGVRGGACTCWAPLNVNRTWRSAAAAHPKIASVAPLTLSAATASVRRSCWRTTCSLVASEDRRSSPNRARRPNPSNPR